MDVREFFYPFLDEQDVEEPSKTLNFSQETKCVVDFVKELRSKEEDPELDREEYVKQHNEVMQKHGLYLRSQYELLLDKIGHVVKDPYLMFQGDFIGQWLLLSMGILPKNKSYIWCLPSFLRMALKNRFYVSVHEPSDLIDYLKHTLQEWQDLDHVQALSMEQIFALFKNTHTDLIPAIYRDLKNMDSYELDWQKETQKNTRELFEKRDELKEKVNKKLKPIIERYLANPTDDQWRYIRKTMNLQNVSKEEALFMLRELVETM